MCCWQRESIKNWDFFVQKKKIIMVMILSYSCLVLDEKMKDKFLWTQKMIKTIMNKEL